MALDSQSKSPLLSMPRELRDQIWWEVNTGNILHVSINPQHLNDARTPKFLFHVCVSPAGHESSACPAGVADHSTCPTWPTPSTYPILQHVCKAIDQELHPSMEQEKCFYSHNAFQFADLPTAEEFLFGLQEWQRASITHLRLTLPWILGEYMETDRDYDAWAAITNYFSVPWERETLHMGADNPYAMEAVKKRVYFCYSDCYWKHNCDRMNKRWQVGLGGASWDVGISDLKGKREPKLDIALPFPTYEPLPMAIFTEFDSRPRWLHSLHSFTQYRDLNIQFYTQQEIKSSPLTQNFVEVTEEEMRPTIGPQKCVYFEK